MAKHRISFKVDPHSLRCNSIWEPEVSDQERAMVQDIMLRHLDEDVEAIVDTHLKTITIIEQVEG